MKQNFSYFQIHKKEITGNGNREKEMEEMETEKKK